jgi:hypothetical protein
MKHYWADNNFKIFRAIVVRHATTMAGMPHACSIRKCARDRACTGPLIACKLPESTIRFAAYNTLQPSEQLVPLCIAIANDEAVAEITAHYRRLIDIYQEDPMAPLTEARKTIDARKWTKIGEIPG